MGAAAATLPLLLLLSYPPTTTSSTLRHLPHPSTSYQHACQTLPHGWWKSRPSDEVRIYCDPSLPLSQRIDDLLTRLTIDEKISLLTNTASAVPSQGIAAYQWWNEALHGVGYSPGVTFKPPTPVATSFPQVITTSHSFNITLVHEIAKAIATEARAFHNAGHAGLTFWAPDINIFRDPRWGRGQEVPGEDPYWTGQYAAWFVRGLQEGEDKRYLKASACCKHFAAYSVEKLPNGTSRHEFNAAVTAQDMADTYLSAFKSCVTQGKSTSIMCSYNAVNGIPSCANSHLLTEIARDDWGFDGYITSDCGAIDDVYSPHNYTTSVEDTCAATLKAGTDLDCGSFYHKNMRKAYDGQKVSEDDLDLALLHLFRVQFRLGLFDPPELQNYTKIGLDKVNTPSHQRLALEAARQGVVLLKNTHNTLPLDPKTISRLALVGPLANATKVMLGNYYGVPAKIISPYEGIKRYITNTVLAEGCKVKDEDITGFADAIQAASESDVTVLVMGLDQTIESEFQDRPSIDVPQVQRKLVEAVVEAARGPVIMVLMSGSAVDVSFAQEDERIPSILFVGYPGQAGGQALAETLFGDNNPSGRLTNTFYKSHYVDQVPLEDMRVRPDPATGYPGRTYRFYNGEVLYPFGHGLSYTNFNIVLSSCTAYPSAIIDEMDDPDDDDDDDGVEPLLQICFVVTNSGPRAGRHALLGFLIPPATSPPGSPRRSLRALHVVSLQPHQSAMVTADIYTQDVSLADDQGHFNIITGTWTLAIDDFQADFSVGI